MKKISYKKILLTHDGSRLASAAIPHIISIAVSYNSEVILVHVVESIEQEMIDLQSDDIATSVGTVADVAQEIVIAQKNKAKKILNQVRSKLEYNGVRTVKIRVSEGFADSKIVEIAKKEKCDLIVMSTHGRSGLGRALLGSVADFVLRHALCPVLLVHPIKRRERFLANLFV
ncbi:hypothetical protein A3F00_00935 [Candidatus Daviesbacteria bacterium RIFCSPHIGHO2_12_FULL_37_11]|uniref:UspA domain-containing protein n=1 Tax=Candidatus Daviesbacteria bacterium RIFCSPHIGHO2_12_FULL_37_11 TaxID=1797777 RepID=A0A1F5K906_9BACT|nr:MAG: hypothetical protein A2769_04530 [Candidatus Daviesbacteria bacterium RIFCSPHIGHO2_01_FULL_37_27]OGE37280.1 MAG: hypothetical protein A3F00_00935 [Candidatus Daviesbacteria bacterium RIFCSPHIGHO2_12_FULL_37_11]OGE46049.1 MAG: hypothetical protein A3B39_03510 [Candidatus Daviesbacteria bacterium RIFCSPLOWO2_01_FULL_37_10]